MEEYPEYQVPEEENQIEEDVKIFDSKYDNEFLGLLSEIGKRLPYFNKNENELINSWLKVLSIPCNSNDLKKNRNLYAIKLINQMINGKLEQPFTNYANGQSDLKWLSPIEIKEELTNKFYEEIDFEKIEKFGNEQQKIFLNHHPDIANKIKTQNNPNPNNNINEYNPNLNNNNNNFLNTNYSYSENNDNNINNYNERPYYSEETHNFPEDNFPIQTNQMQFNRQNKSSMNNTFSNKNNETAKFSTVHNKKNNFKNYNDKIKLINIIRDLEQKVIERDEIIEFQNKQIEQIINRITFIQNLQNSKNANNPQYI